MVKLSIGVALVGAALLISGCAQKPPMEHLPDCMGYFCMNAAQLRQEAGAKRAMDAVNKIDPSPQSSDKLQRMYMGISGIGARRPNVYAIMLGLPGFADSSLSDMKGKGATETKVNGKKGATLKGATFVALTDGALLFSPEQSSLDTMFQVAKKKSPSALGSSTFRKLQELEGAHGVTVAVNATQIISMASSQLGMLSALNPKGVEALKQVQTATLVADWDQAPKVELTLYHDSEDGRKALSDLANFGLEQAKQQMARAGAGVPPAIGDMIKGLQVKPDSDGVKLALEFPKELADGALDELDKLVANLPSDPKERERALEKAVQGFIMKQAMGSRGGPAGAQRPVAPAGTPSAAMTPAAVAPVAPPAGAGLQAAPTAVRTPAAAAPAVPGAPVTR